jgi:hypothetical protein
MQTNSTPSGEAAQCGFHSPIEKRQRPAVVCPSPDFAVTGGGTVFLFHPLTTRATGWLEEHCPPNEDHQYLGRALAVEHRYIKNFVQLSIRDGLVPAANFQQQGRN